MNISKVHTYKRAVYLILKYKCLIICIWAITHTCKIFYLVEKSHKFELKIHVFDYIYLTHIIIQGEIQIKPTKQEFLEIM